jgi:hypothetical protein
VAGPWSASRFRAGCEHTRRSRSATDDRVVCASARRERSTPFVLAGWGAVRLAGAAGRGVARRRGRRASGSPGRGAAGPRGVVRRAQRRGLDGWGQAELRGRRQRESREVRAPGPYPFNTRRRSPIRAIRAFRGLDPCRGRPLDTAGSRGNYRRLFKPMLSRGQPWRHPRGARRPMTEGTRTNARSQT